MPFDRLAALVKDEIGVKLPPNKRVMVESRLHRRMVALGLPNLEAYVDQLFAGGTFAEERDLIFDAVTTNKTDFFREPGHFRLLAETIIPQCQSGRRLLKVWSAAASTGAEAYSIAMVCAAAAQIAPFTWGVLATDINTEVLKTGARAVYDDETLAPVPPAFAERWLMRGVAEMAGRSRIHPDLRRRVRFERLNLMAAEYPVDHDVDAIFLRNVLIYFEADDQARVIRQLARHLVPGGYLIVGHSESMVVRDPALRQVNPAVFRKE